MTTKVKEKIYLRALDLSTILVSRSRFFLGPRLTGKSTLIRETNPEALVFDLLNNEVYFSLLESHFRSKTWFLSIRKSWWSPIVKSCQRGRNFKNFVCVYMGPLPKHIDGIETLSYTTFLEYLWEGS